MKLLLHILLLAVLSLSCGSKKKIPEDVLSQKQMTVVMWDLVKADEFVNNYIMKDSTKDRKTESVKLYEQVFRIHNITKEEFQKSIVFYQGRPDLLKNVLDSLRGYESKIPEEIYKPVTPVDSFKRKPFVRSS